MQKRNGSSSIYVYERVIVGSFIYFVKALNLYTIYVNYRIIHPEPTINPKNDRGHENILSTIKKCGNNLVHLPVPPPGAEQIDQLFRDLGKEIIHLAGTIEQFSTATGKDKQNQIAADFHDQSVKIKKGLREAVENYATVYPGQLTHALQSFQRPALDDSAT